MIPGQVVPRHAEFVVEERIRVEDRVAGEIKSAAVKFVGARFGHHADHAGGVASILRRVVAGQDPEFGDRIRVRIQDHAVGQQVIVVAAVQQVGNRIRPSAGDAVVSRAREIRIAFGDARLQQRQIQYVASIQRQVDQLAAGHRLPQRRIFRLHSADLRLHRHRLVRRAHGQRNIKAQRLVDQQLFRLGHHSVEAGVLDRDAVVSNRQIEYFEVSVLAGHRRLRDLGGHIGDRHIRGRHDSALLVVHGSDHPASRVLCGEGSVENENRTQEKNRKEKPPKQAQESP